MFNNNFNRSSNLNSPICSIRVNFYNNLKLINVLYYTLLNYIESQEQQIK